MQSFNAVGCLSQVLHLDVILNCWDFIFVYFVKLNIGYQPGNFHISQLFGSNFTGGW